MNRRLCLDDAINDVAIWRQAGADSVCIDTMNRGLSGGEQHLGLLRQIAEMLALSRT